MATQKLKPKAAKMTLDGLLLEQDSEVVRHLHRESKRLGGPMPLDELHALLNKELGELSLSEELLRMRHED